MLTLLGGILVAIGSLCLVIPTLMKRPAPVKFANNMINAGLAITLITSAYYVLTLLSL